MPTPDRPGPRGQGQWKVSDLDRKLGLKKPGHWAEASGIRETPRGSGSEVLGGSMEGLGGVASMPAAPTPAEQWTSASVVSWRPGGGSELHGDTQAGLCWWQGNWGGQAEPAMCRGTPSLACSSPIMWRSSRLS